MIRVKLQLQQYLDEKYPTKKDKEKVKFLKLYYLNWGDENNDVVSEEEKQESGFEGIQSKFKDVEGKDKAEIESEILDLKEYPKIKEIDLAEMPLIKLILGEKTKLTYLTCRNSKLTRLDLKDCSNLVKFSCEENPLVSLIYPNNNPREWVQKAWQKVKGEFEKGDRGEFSMLDRLIDNSDLDDWVANCDFRIGDTEYYKFCGGDGKHSCFDYETIENLGNKIMFRRLVIFYRSLDDKGYLDIDKHKLYEEKVSRVVDDNYILMTYVYRNSSYDEWVKNKKKRFIQTLTEGERAYGHVRLAWIWEKKEKELEKIARAEVLDKALDRNLELLNSFQDLPYLKKEFQLPSTKIFWQNIREVEEKKDNQLEHALVTEREELDKVLEKAQEWRERQIKEITEQKDKEIKELKEELEKLNSNQNKEDKATQTEAQILVLEQPKMPGSWFK